MKENLVIHDLVKEALQKERYLTTSTTGISMSPLLRPGDEIQIRWCSPREIKMGDIALFKMDERLIIHRVHRIETDSNQIPIRFITKGDAVSLFDSPLETRHLVAKMISCGKNYSQRLSWKFHNWWAIILIFYLPKLYERLKKNKWLHRLFSVLKNLLLKLRS